MPARVAITGANGMLGRDLLAVARARGLVVLPFTRAELDVTDPTTYHRMSNVEWVINCAGFTNVDGAESDAVGAEAANVLGPARLAAWCASRNMALCHISTDYVFDGLSHKPCMEEDPIHPLGLYAKTKARGEGLVRESGARHLIVRTQGLFGWQGRNFIKTILDLLLKGEPLKVVNDQWTAPTYTRHLADALLDLVEAGCMGTVHASAEGECSWYELAVFVRNETGLSTTIKPVTTAEFPRPAQRPAYSVLDKTRLYEWTGRRLPHWQEGVQAYLAELKGQRR